MGNYQSDPEAHGKPTESEATPRSQSKRGPIFLPAKPSNQYIPDCTCCHPKDAVKMQIVKQITTGYGRTTEVNISPDPDGTERFYVAHEPPNSKRLTKDGKKHGSAWDSAVDETSWRTRSKEGFFVVYHTQRFGQARGPLFVHPTRAPGDEFGLGGTFWQSVYPDNDIRYVDEVLHSVMGLFPGEIDTDRIYFMGFSSGGLFAYPLCILLGHRFAAIVNYMGGIQQDNDQTALPPLSASTGKPPVFIITGTEDSHRSRCEEAKNLLEGAGYPVTYQILAGKKHSYHTEDVEPLALNFFRAHALVPRTPEVAVDAAGSSAKASAASQAR